MVTTVYPLLNVVVALTPRYQDALRYALALGLEVKFPPKIPPNTLKVMRVLTAIHLRQPNALEEATKAFFEAAWVFYKQRLFTLHTSLRQALRYNYVLVPTACQLCFSLHLTYNG
eukprot:GHVT01045383.1.p1 GENE.GHVT01045383.1~~GHVT01045383.1.p1  ORF type:complete len:115 (+),score=1.24 GHVT01045383.1:682-1026(+)